MKRLCFYVIVLLSLIVIAGCSGGIVKPNGFTDAEKNVAGIEWQFRF